MTALLNPGHELLYFHTCRTRPVPDDHEHCTDESLVVGVPLFTALARLISENHQTSMRTVSRFVLYFPPITCRPTGTWGVVQCTRDQQCPMWADCKYLCHAMATPDLFTFCVSSPTEEWTVLKGRQTYPPWERPLRNSRPDSRLRSVFLPNFPFWQGRLTLLWSALQGSMVWRRGSETRGVCYCI